MRITDETVVFATRAWYEAARREQFKADPNRPYATWEQLDMSTRLSFMRCMKAALIAVKTQL
jgi:hypothetical protein